MKNIVKILAVAASIFAFASCETYKVAAPDTTAIGNIDGKYVAFAYEDGADEPSTLLAIVITNTTNNDSNKAWMTIADTDPSIYSRNYLDAVRFQIDVDPKAQTIKANAVSATEPTTCWNPYVESAYGTYGSYYTGAYATKKYSNYTISLDGKVITGGAKTLTGTADTIEFTYSRTYPSGYVETLFVKGMVKTGWMEDLQEYEDFYWSL